MISPLKGIESSSQPTNQSEKHITRCLRMSVHYAMYIELSIVIINRLRFNTTLTFTQQSFNSNTGTFVQCCKNYHDILHSCSINNPTIKNNVKIESRTHSKFTPNS